MTPAEAHAALMATKPGDTFVFPRGFRGILPTVRGLRERTLACEEDVVIGGLYLLECFDLDLMSLVVQLAPTLTTTSSESGMRLNLCERIAIGGGDFSTGLLPEGGGWPETSEPTKEVAGRIEGWPIGRAMTIDASRNITLRKALVHDCQRGVVFSKIEDAIIEGIEVRDTRGAMITGGTAQRLMVRGNWLHRAKPWKPGGTYGDHLDAFHHHTRVQTVPSDRICFVENDIDMEDRETFPSVLYEDNALVGYTNADVSGNRILNGHINGLVLENITSGQVCDNLLLQAGSYRFTSTGAPDPRDAPAIKLSKSVVLNEGAAITAPNPNVAVTGNRSVDPHGLFALYPGNEKLAGGVRPAEELAAVRGAILARFGDAAPEPEPTPIDWPAKVAELESHVAALREQVAITRALMSDMQAEAVLLYARIDALVAERDRALSLARQARAARAKNAWIDQIIALLSAPAP